jgi:hypothetical protein
MQTISVYHSQVAYNIKFDIELQISPSLSLSLSIYIYIYIYHHQNGIYLQDTTENPMWAADIALHFSVQQEL